MSSVGQHDTGPEMCLRRALHRLGFRYRLNDRKLPGSPDLIFPRFRAVIFVHGCFWHSHGCKFSTIPSTRREFWLEKFEANRKRDRAKNEQLFAQGWRVLVVWECAIKEGKKLGLDELAASIGEWLKSDEPWKEIGVGDIYSQHSRVADTHPTKPYGQ
jgi:DNA mismatch endonuclease (patch repair protein)